jgi:hypothetical protein
MRVNVQFDEIDLVVVGNFEPAQMQTMDDRGYDEDFEIESVFTAHGDDITLLFDFEYIDESGETCNRMDDLKEETLDAIREQYPEEYDDE